MRPQTLSDPEPETPRNGELLPPDDNSSSGGDPALSQTFLALVSNYTDRPDLLIAEIEKHDPGFVKRMNEAAERDAESLRKARFKFGRFQAYLAAIISGIAAVSILAIIAMAVYLKSSFTAIISLGLIYAITQGGTAGFIRIIDSIKDIFKNRKDDDTSKSPE